MDRLDRIAALAWTAYRRLRFDYYALTGRSPLIGASNRIPLSRELRGVEGLLAGRREPQLIRTDSSGFTLWRTPMGDNWTPPGANLDYVRRIPAEIMAESYPLDYPSALPEEAVFLDCGGNTGLFVRHALQHGAGRVVTFEPSPVTLECLNRNLASEIASRRVTCIPKGVWSSERIISFSAANTGNPASHYVDEEGGGDVSVPVTTIDHTVQQLALPRVDYIKMDIEGSEVQALAGAVQTIRRFRPRLAIATEHTADQIANTRQVIEAVLNADPGYRYVALEQHVLQTPQGRLLVPFTLLFVPDADARQAAAAA